MNLNRLNRLKSKIAAVMILQFYHISFQRSGPGTLGPVSISLIVWSGLEQPPSVPNNSE